MENYGLVGTTLQGPSEGAKTPPVTLAVENLRRNVEQAHIMLSELTNRLSPILSPEPPSNMTEGGPKLPANGLSYMLVEIAGNVNALSSRISSIFERLEI